MPACLHCFAIIFGAPPCTYLDKYQPMQLILEGADEHEITCPHCQWHGIATELKKGDYFILTNITELFCPMCNKYVGFLQHDSGKADEKDSGPG